MRTFFLDKEYVALSLIRAKYQIFRENFITISELEQYQHFLQQEFNNRDLNIIITSDTLTTENFNIIGEIIITSNNCGLNLLPINVLSILYDTNLVTDFFIKLEKEKLETLKRTRSVTSKSPKKVTS